MEWAHATFVLKTEDLTKRFHLHIKKRICPQWVHEKVPLIILVESLTQQRIRHAVHKLANIVTLTYLGSEKVMRDLQCNGRSKQL